MSKGKEYSLLIAVVGLTLISVTAGFDFYHSLFDLTTAILCCVILETIRLACILSFVLFGWLKKILAIPVYTLVALTCAFAGITSFHARIIKSHAEAIKPLEKEVAKRIDLINHAYAQNVLGNLKRLDEKIDLCNRKLAWNPTSHYWKNRKTQLTSERKQIVTERDLFLSEIPKEGQERWLARHAALLGVDLEPLSVTLRGSTATTKAIRELWGVSELTARKMVAIIIVVTVEFGIILLSLLAKGESKKEISTNRYNHRVLKALRNRFQGEEIRRFCEKYRKHGRMPPSRTLGRKNREIRKFLVDEGFNGDEIGELVEVLS